MKKKRIIPNVGDRRIKSGFLWFPKCIEYFDLESDHYINDVRWLCRAVWIEEAVTTCDIDGYPYSKWVSRSWSD